MSASNKPGVTISADHHGRCRASNDARYLSAQQAGLARLLNQSVNGADNLTRQLRHCLIFPLRFVLITTMLGCNDFTNQFVQLIMRLLDRLHGGGAAIPLLACSVVPATKVTFVG